MGIFEGNGQDTIIRKKMGRKMRILHWCWNKVVSKWWFWLIIVAIYNTVAIKNISRQLAVLNSKMLFKTGIFHICETGKTAPCDNGTTFRLVIEERDGRVEVSSQPLDEQSQAIKSATSTTVPSETPAPKEQDCTPELAMQAYSDKGASERKDSAEVLTYFQKIHKTIDSLPVPTQLPALPDIAVHVADWNQLKAVKNEQGKCVPVPTKTMATESHGGGSWRSVFALLVGGFGQWVREDTDDEDRYQTQVGFSGLDKYAYLLYHWSQYGEFSAGSLEGIRKVVLQVVEDEEKLETLAQWAIPLLPTLLTGSQGQAKQWLRDFWQASQVDFSSLKAKVAEYDKQTTSADPYRETYYYQHNSKREGMFLRRWINKGGGKAGDEHILVLRFWMVRVAEALGMPEAKAWANSIQSKMRGATTLKLTPYYIDELKRIRGVP